VSSRSADRRRELTRRLRSWYSNGQIRVAVRVYLYSEWSVFECWPAQLLVVTRGYEPLSLKISKRIPARRYGIFPA
jgi:hypothetical protein